MPDEDASSGRRRQGTSPDDVSWALHRLVVAAAALDVALARRLGLGSSDYQALKHLMTAGRPLGPVELGALVGLTSGAATTLVDRLERAGHLARRRDPGDRRRVSLEPTPAALDRARQQLRPLEGALGDLLATYPDAEREVIARFLDDAVAAYGRFGADTSRGAVS